MIRNPNTAKQISDLMHDVFRRVDESTQIVKTTSSADDFAACNKRAFSGPRAREAGWAFLFDIDYRISAVKSLHTQR
jgi:hypothetical protein